MADYEKWLGAGLGYVVGGPVGGLLGYFTSGAPEEKKFSHTSVTSSFETNILVLAAAVIRADLRIAPVEIDFVRNFFETYFEPAHIQQKMAILNHCLQKDYDVRKACDELRSAASMVTRRQILQFLFEVAASDQQISKEEEKLLFRLAGWLNINDVEFRKLKIGRDRNTPPHYALLDLKVTASENEIRAAYRKAVLDFHPDRHAEKSDEEKKRIHEKFLALQNAWEQIRTERGF
ncbi:MAG: TerB family tellurite resistance protein [Chitinophagales bacterium]